MSTYRHLPSASEIIVIWDDYVRERDIDFEKIRAATSVPFRVVLQSHFGKWPDCIGSWGWIKQQLAKLQCHRFTSTRYNFVIDGDVIVTGDPDLFDGQTPKLRADQSFCVPETYKFFGSRYLGIKNWHTTTFVGSSGLFDKQICLDMERQCQDHCGMTLLEAVKHMLENDDHPNLPFSEFEYYGHLAGSQGAVVHAKNWNYVTFQSLWQLPLQVMWADGHSQDQLDHRYCRLMEHQNPIG